MSHIQTNNEVTRMGMSTSTASLKLYRQAEHLFLLLPINFLMVSWGRLQIHVICETANCSSLVHIDTGNWLLTAI